MKSSILSLVLILSFSPSIGHSQTSALVSKHPISQEDIRKHDSGISDPDSVQSAARLPTRFQAEHYLAMGQAPPVPPAPDPVLKISGPSTFQEGTLAQYTVPGSTNASFMVFPIGSGSSYITSDGVFVFTAPAATYQLLAATTNKDNKIVFLTLAITITGSNTPPSGPLAIVIFDSSQLTNMSAGQVAIYQSSTIASSLESSGITYLMYDSHDIIPSKGGSSPLMNTTWGSSTQSTGLPALVVSSNGTVSAVPLPQNQAQLITQVLSMKNK